jgi:hypothetical protein
MAEHAYLEPEAAVANYPDGMVTLLMPGKYPHSDHRQISQRCCLWWLPTMLAMP